MRKFQRAFERIERFAQLKMKEHNIPGLVIGVTDKEKLLRISTYGFANIEAQLPITPDSAFEIASIGKNFTAVALLQLRDEGRLDLRAPVTEYLPWFRVRSAYPPITVHHLLSHTAGIIRGTEAAPNGPYECWALGETDTSAPPGQHWHYSSLGYKVLGLLLETLTGQSLAEAIRARVLDPLGMTSTDPSSTFETHKRTVPGYCSLYDDRPEDASQPLVPAPWTEYAGGDGCQVSTVADVATFLRMLMNYGRGARGPLISEQSFDLMAPLARRTNTEEYGYALVAYPVDDHVWLGHGGGNAGYACHIIADVEEGLGVVHLINRRTESEAVFQSADYALKVLRAASRDEPLPPAPRADESRHIANAAEYAGTYRAGDSLLRLTAEGDTLSLEHAGQVVRLERRWLDSFYAAHSQLNLFLLEFQRDGGEVIEVWHGSRSYVKDGRATTRRRDHPEQWEAYVGHYRRLNMEMSNFRVVIRNGTLAFVVPYGSSQSLVPIGDGAFRVGGDPRSPETLRFDAVIEGRALRAEYSGCSYYRSFNH